MFTRFLLGFILSASLIAAIDWRDMFPGVTPAAQPGPEWIINYISYKSYNPYWEGVIETYSGSHLSNLDEEQLTRLATRIQAIMGDDHQIYFTKPETIDSHRQAIYVENVHLALMIPSINIDLFLKIIHSNLQVLMISGAKRTTTVLEGMSLGQAWRYLREFIAHYKRGIMEAAYLLENMPSDERVHTEKSIPHLVAIYESFFEQLDELYQQVDTEFEKPQRMRNTEKMHKDLYALIKLLDGEQMGKFITNSGLDVDIKPLIKFAEDQPTLLKLKAFSAIKHVTTTSPPVLEKTTNDILFDLSRQSRNDIGVALEQGGEGLIMTIRFDNRLWNIYKLNDPKNEALQHQLQLRTTDQQGQNQEMEMKLMNMEHCATYLAQQRHFKEGRYTLLLRDYSGNHQFENHQFNVVRINVIPGGWNYTTQQPSTEAKIEAYLGLIEIREAREGDKTSFYDPMREHSVNSIRKTMMEQRLQDVMNQYRVHRFSALPQKVQHELRSEIERYNTNRHITNMENQRMKNFAITRAEKKLREGASDIEKELVAKRRADKISQELSNRLAVSRYQQINKHGGDLTEKPEQYLKTQPIEFSRRIHFLNKDLSDREKEFYGKNYEGGYLDTVENAIAHHQEQFNPQSGEAIIRFDAEHLHHTADQRLHKAPYNVSYGYGTKSEHPSSASAQAHGLAAPTPSYEYIEHALNDYDMH